MDIIIALFEELLGGKKQPQSQPRRRVRPGDTSGTGTRSASRPAGPAAPEQGNEFEEMVRQLFGAGAAQEAQEPPPAPASPPPPPPRREQPRRERPSRKQAAAPTQRRMVPEAPLSLDESRPSLAVPPVPPIAVDMSARRTVGKMPDFVARLRGDAAAAREAFVYSEIFGLPVADREESRW